MADINFETEELARLMAEVNRQMDLYGQVTKQTKDELYDAEMKAKWGINNATKAFESAGTAVGSLAKAAGQAAASMYNNKKGASAFNDTLDSLSTAATAAGVALMLLGGPVKIIIGVLGLAAGAAFKFTKTINEQSDALYKGFQDLNAAGGSASDGMAGLFRNIQQLGLGFQEMESFTRLIGENSRDLANFSGSVFRGRQEFSKIGQAMEPFRQGLFNAGMNQEQLNEGTMAYLSLQTRLGRSQSMTVDQLANGANKYLIEMDALTKLTGASRKEIEDQRKEAMIEEQFRAKLRQMELSGNKEGAERLRKYNDLMTSINPELGKGIRALSTGNLAAEEAQRLMLTSSGQAAVDLNKVLAGTLPLAAAADRTTAAIGQFSDGIGVNLALLKANDQAFMSFAAQQDIRIAREKGFSETLAQINQDQVDQGVTGRKAADKAQQEQTELRLRQQKAMLSLQRMVNIGVEPATTAMSWFAKVVANVSIGLEKFMNRFGLGPDRELTEAEIKANAELKKHQDEIMALERKRLEAKTNADKKLIDEEIRAARKRATVASQVQKQTEKQAKADYEAGRPGVAAAAAPDAASAAPTATTAPTAPTSRSVGGAGGPQGGHATEGGGSGDSGKPKLARVSSVSGQSTAVNEKYAPAFQSLIDYLDKAGYEINSLGGYVDRDVRGKPGVKSVHALGGAIDINPTTNPLSSTLITDMPSEIGSVAASLGLGWGGNWKSRKDAMHFSAAQSEGGSLLKASDGGMFSGPASGYNVELHGKEAVIPLKNGAVPVSLNLKDALGGPTFAGSNEYAGYNMGPMSTDLNAIKDIAAKLGAYDAATKMITDPTTWKQILNSGIAMNYNLGMAEIGTKLLPGIGQEIGNRIQELKSSGGSDTGSIIKQVASEFKTALSDAVRNMSGGSDPTMAAGQLDALNQLIQEQKNSNSIQEKLLRAAAS